MLLAAVELKRRNGIIFREDADYCLQRRRSCITDASLSKARHKAIGEALTVCCSFFNPIIYVIMQNLRLCKL